MKKISMCFVAVLFLMMSCKKNEVCYPAWTYNYIYINDCSSEITINSFSSDDYYGNEPIESFTIPARGAHTTTYDSGGRALPFNETGTNGLSYSYVTISKDEKSITQRGADNDELYNENNYIFISEKDFERTMLYIFTDDFFADGKP